MGIIYNRLFGSSHSTGDNRPVKDLLFDKSNEICARTTHDGLNLEDKVLLSMTIRLQAEVFLTNELRRIKSDENYWCLSMNQFGNLVKEYNIVSTNSTRDAHIGKDQHHS